MPYLYVYDRQDAFQSQEPPTEMDAVKMRKGVLRVFTLVGELFTELTPGNVGMKWEDVPGVKAIPVSEKDTQRAWLLKKGWEYVMTEEEGCETWTFPWDKRRGFPDCVMSKGQHYWDLDEAVAAQKEMDKFSNVA